MVARKKLKKLEFESRELTRDPRKVGGCREIEVRPEMLDWWGRWWCLSDHAAQVMDFIE